MQIMRDFAVTLQGEHAHRVWNAIYSQQCFSDLNDTDTCQEQRIFYRLISGKPLCLQCSSVSQGGLSTTKINIFKPACKGGLSSLRATDSCTKSQSYRAKPVWFAFFHESKQEVIGAICTLQACMLR